MSAELAHAFLRAPLSGLALSRAARPYELLDGFESVGAVRASDFLVRLSLTGLAPAADFLDGLASGGAALSANPLGRLNLGELASTTDVLGGLALVGAALSINPFGGSTWVGAALATGSVEIVWSGGLT